MGTHLYGGVDEGSRSSNDMYADRRASDLEFMHLQRQMSILGRHGRGSTSDPNATHDSAFPPSLASSSVSFSFGIVSVDTQGSSTTAMAAGISGNIHPEVSILTNIWVGPGVNQYVGFDQGTVATARNHDEGGGQASVASMAAASLTSVGNMMVMNVDPITRPAPSTSTVGDVTTDNANASANAPAAADSADKTTATKSTGESTAKAAVSNYAPARPKDYIPPPSYPARPKDYIPPPSYPARPKDYIPPPSYPGSLAPLRPIARPEEHDLTELNSITPEILQQYFRSLMERVDIQGGSNDASQSGRRRSGKRRKKGKAVVDSDQGPKRMWLCLECKKRMRGPDRASHLLQHGGLQQYNCKW